MLGVHTKGCLDP
jgi:hypothetical protein